MSVQAATGTKIYVGTTAAATSLTSFKADTYTQISQVQNFGAFGDESEIIKFTSLSDSRVHKVAGPRDAGDVELTIGYDLGDAGQDELIAAFEANAGSPFNFECELNDALTTGLGPHSGTSFFWKGVVISKRIETGSSTDVVKLIVKVAITSPVVIGDAA